MDLSQAFEGFGEDYRHASHKVLVTDNFGPRIKVRQEIAYGVGGQLWDAAYLLSQYVARLYPGNMTNLRVLELGAGCALPSIVCCIKGAQVTATDIPPVLSLTQANLALNSGLFTGNYTVQQLDWTNASHRTALAGPYDIVLMSDLFYMPVSRYSEPCGSAVIDPFSCHFCGKSGLFDIQISCFSHDYPLFISSGKSFSPARAVGSSFFHPSPQSAAPVRAFAQ